MLGIDWGVLVEWVELMGLNLFTGLLVSCLARLVWAGVVDVEGGVDVVWVRLARFRFFTRRMVFCITMEGFDVRAG